MDRIKTFILFLALMTICSTGYPQSEESPKIIQIELHECEDKALGIKILCNGEWGLQTEEGAILMIISTDPAVTLTIARSESPVIFLKQLTNPVLQELGQYADGFSNQMVQVAGEDAILVEGAPQNQQEIYLKDYYLIHNFDLYSILFSVNPKENSYQYQRLFSDLLDSIEFIE